MAQALTAGALVIAAGDLSLLLISWRRRSVLAGILAVVGFPLLAFALATGRSRTASELGVLTAAVALVLGTALYAIGQVLERLLEQGPDESD